MTTDQLVTLLTVGAVPLILGLLLFAQDRMKRSDALRDAEDEAARLDREKAAKVAKANQDLRERYFELRNRSMRRFQSALDRVDNERYPEARRVLESSIEEFERIELPPLD